MIPEQWKDDALLAELKKKNEEKIAALDKKIADAEELEGMTHVKLNIYLGFGYIGLNLIKRSLGDQDVRDATIDKAHYLAQIGDKEESIKIFGTGMYRNRPWITYHDRLPYKIYH